MDRPTITLLYFASLRTSIDGQPSSQELPIPSHPTPFTLYDLRTHLVRDVHRGNVEFEHALERSAWSVDEEMVTLESESAFPLKPGQVVCGIPPVSGG